MGVVLTSWQKKKKSTNSLAGTACRLGSRLMGGSTSMGHLWSELDSWSAGDSQLITDVSVGLSYTKMDSGRKGLGSWTWVIGEKTIGVRYSFIYQLWDLKYSSRTTREQCTYFQGRSSSIWGDTPNWTISRRIWNCSRWFELRWWTGCKEHFFNSWQTPDPRGFRRRWESIS